MSCSTCRSPRDITPRTFDHTLIAQLPEYHVAREAIDNLINAASEAESPVAVEEIVDMVRTSYAADNCNCPSCCVEHRRSGYRLNLGCWPFKAEVTDGWMRGTYRCPRTGRTWTCGYTAELDVIAGMP